MESNLSACVPWSRAVAIAMRAVMCAVLSAVMALPIHAAPLNDTLVSPSGSPIQLPVSISADGTVRFTCPAGYSVIGFESLKGTYPDTATHVSTNTYGPTLVCSIVGSGYGTMENGYLNEAVPTEDGNYWVRISKEGTAYVNTDFSGEWYYWTARRVAGVWSTIPIQAVPLNDTGITAFGDATSNTLPTEPADYPGQDASYGRDAAAQAGTLTKIGGGRAGFDFTKLDANGNDLLASAIEWSCVRDNVTGLIWEVKTDDGGLRDKDNHYTWYNPDNTSNGGVAGTQDGGSCVGSSCDTYGYTQAVNVQGLCGRNDWRMPMVEELLSIVDYSIPYPGPMIDTGYFPNTVSDGVFWSASLYAGDSYSAWYIVGSGGESASKKGTTKGHVRLVRGGQ